MFPATEKLSAASSVPMPANRVPVIVNAVTPIVSETYGDGDDSRHPLFGFLVAPVIYGEGEITPSSGVVSHCRASSGRK